MKIFLCCIFLLVINTTYSQIQQKTQKEDFEIKKDQLTLDLEPLLNIGLTGSRAINKKSSVGIGFSFGIGIKYFLNNPLYLYCGTGCDSGDCCAIQKIESSGKFNFELFKIFIFYRHYYSKHLNINIGIFSSFGSFLIIERNNNNTIAGVQMSTFYGFKSFKIGVRFQAGRLFLTYDSRHKSQSNVILISPVLQYYF
ncbi:MAG: hypothetical protein K8R58_05570 [Bacteroidales bacterium]|nr:hypothetical protein [Bacteroidales bacterium]